MKKNYKIISVLFIISFLILAVSSCGTPNSGITGNVSATTKLADDQTSSSFDLTKELNTLKEKLINPPVVTSHKPYQELLSGSGKELVIIRGKSDVGTSIAIKVNGILAEKRYTVDNSGDFETGDGVEIVEGMNTVEVYALRAGDEKSEPTKLVFFIKNQKELSFTIYSNADSLIEISSQFYSKEIEPHVYIKGFALPIVDVFLKINDKIIGQTLSGDAGIFSFGDVQLSQGSNIISVWYSSGDNQPSAQVDKEINVSKDILSPDPSSLTGFVGSDGNHLAWAQSTDIEFVSYKIIRVDDPAKNSNYPENDVIATIVDKNISSYTDTDIILGKAYFYTLWTLDKAGNLTSSNVLPLPAPKYTISLSRMPELQGNIIARREWYYEYYEITNTGNVPVYIQPILVWFLLDPESDPEMALNPLWGAYIWDPSSGTYYYENTDIRESHVSDWISRGTTKRTETVTYSTDNLTRTTTVLEIYKIAEETVGKRIVTLDKTTTVTVENLVTGVSTTTTAHEVSNAIAEPEKIGTLIGALEPGDKIKLAVKITNVAADNGDKIVVHFNFAPADSLGFYFTDDIVSTGDIFITSSGK